MAAAIAAVVAQRPTRVCALPWSPTLSQQPSGHCPKCGGSARQAFDVPNGGALMHAWPRPFSMASRRSPTTRPASFRSSPRPWQEHRVVLVEPPKFPKLATLVAEPPVQHASGHYIAAGSIGASVAGNRYLTGAAGLHRLCLSRTLPRHQWLNRKMLTVGFLLLSQCSIPICALDGKLPASSLCLPGRRSLQPPTQENTPSWISF